jgi:hypothetical protein
MTLRIFEQAGEGEAVIALHGWLSAAGVGEVERLAAAQSRPVSIDLAQLAGVDVEGLRALLRLRGEGARLTGASPYVELLLERTIAGDGKTP